MKTRRDARGCSLLAAAASLCRADAPNAQYIFKIADALTSAADEDESDGPLVLFCKPPAAQPVISLWDIKIGLKRRRQDQAEEQNCRMALGAVLKQLMARR
ncbi:MAG TPA: hypothetical protein VND94_09655 [Terriglobia bacterium]|nr:hypothetical protein [Terriglobia bacterium]